jgi:hypothetical protein
VRHDFSEAIPTHIGLGIKLAMAGLVQSGKRLREFIRGKNKEKQKSPILAGPGFSCLAHSAGFEPATP